LKKSEDKAKEDKKKAAEKPSVTVFGRLYVDTVAFGQNAQSRLIFDDAKDTTFFRSARFGVMGDMFDVMSYVCEIDFAARDPQDFDLIAFRHTYLQIKDLPWLDKVRVGHFKEPLSLEQMISSRFTTFMERSLSDIFVPAFNTGVMTFSNTQDERATWALGAFAVCQDTPPFAREDSPLTGDGTSGTVRGTWTPWYDEATQGRGLLHVGMGYRYENLTASTQRLRTRPEVAVGPYVVDTTMNADFLPLTDVLVSHPVQPHDVELRAFRRQSQQRSAGHLHRHAHDASSIRFLDRRFLDRLDTKFQELNP
jgi:phosphate-selective porin OprO/OprP